MTSTSVMLLVEEDAHEGANDSCHNRRHEDGCCLKPVLRITPHMISEGNVHEEVGEGGDRKREPHTAMYPREHT